MQAAQGTDSGPGATATPIITLEPTLQATFPAALLEAWPADGSVLDRQPEITFYFNQPMNRTSVEKNLTFQPPLPGKFTWVDGATLKYTPDLPLPLLPDLKIDLDSRASALSGQTFQPAVSLTYHFPSALKIRERIPKPESSQVDPSGPLMISFNQPIVPLMAGAKADDTPAFTLSPQAEGKGTWLNTSTYMFYPAPALKGNTTYQITLRPDLVGGQQGGDWKFTTARIAVSFAKPDPADGLLSLDGLIQIQFNQPVNRQSVEKKVTLRSKLDQALISGSFTWDDNSTLATYKPSTLLGRDTSYLLTVPAAVQAGNGESLAEDKTYEYHTISALSLQSTTPRENEKLVYSSGYNVLQLKFNTPLAHQSFLPLITIDPPVKDASAYTSDDNTINLNGLFTPDTLYHLTVSQDLKDHWGGKLGGPVTFNFTTTPARPSLNIPMLQYNSTVFLRPEDINMSVQATNLNTLLVQSQHLQLNEFLTLDGDYQARDAFGLTKFDAWMLRFSNTNQGKQVPISLAKPGVPLKPGLYFYKLSSSDMEQNKTKEVNFLAVVSRIHLTLKRSLNEMFVWAVDLKSNQPVPQKAMLLYNASGDKVDRCTTDSKGTCAFDLPQGIKNADTLNYYVVMDNPGEADFAMGVDSWSSGVSGNDFGISNQVESAFPYVYVYTDRPIYRPGQTVYFRAIVRKADNGRYQPAGLTHLNAKLVGDYSEDAHRAPADINLPLNLSSYGTASGSFTLPSDAPVGYYHFEFTENVKMDYAGFAVAAYKKPQVDMQLQFAASDLKVGNDLHAELKAKYYFGAPAGKLPITWALYAAPDWISLPDGFQAGTQETLWSNMGWFGGLGPEIANGSGITGIDGALNIIIPAGDLDRLDVRTLNHLTLEATLTDKSNSQVSVRASMQLHPADLYFGVRPDAWNTEAGKEMGFVVQSTDWKSAPVGGQRMSASLQKVTWQDPDMQSVLDVLAYPTPHFAQVDSVDLTTDSSGQARIAFTPTEPGDYRLELTGEGALTQMWLWVGGAGSTTWANLPNQHLKISTDASEYGPKQTAHLFVPNPLGPNALALITVERGKVMESDVVSISGSSLVYDLPVTEDMAPNVYLSVTLLGHTMDGRPDFRQGYQEIKVKPTRETLHVAFVAQPQSTAPGSNVLLAVQVKDSQGQAVKGEFSVSMVDKAVLALADANSKDIVSAFYGPNELGVMTSLSLAGYINRLSQFTANGKGGGGGSSPEVRQNFADTAFWTGNVETDEHGMAQFQVKLPDNLTTWVALVRGLTQDTRVGEAVLDITTSKPLMVQPIVPRFGVVGDHIQLGAVVYNNTASPLATEVALAVNGLKLDNQDQAVQKVTIEPMGNVRLNWWVRVEDVPGADLIFSAVSGDLVDQTRLEQGNLPVVRYETTQTSATVGLMTEMGSQSQLIQMPRSFVPTGGELRMEFSPSLAATVLDGLKYENPNAYASNESLVSTLLPDINVYQVLQKNNQPLPDLKTRLDNTARDHILRLQANQNLDGGWGWTKGYATNDFMSAYVLLGLGKAAEAGYTIDPAVLQKGQQYIQNRLIAQHDLMDGSNCNRHVFMQFALQSSGVADHFSGVSMDDWNASYQFMGKLSPWSEALLALGVKRAQPENSMSSLIASDLVSKVSHMPSGVSWIESQPDQMNFSSPNFNTAVVIYALSQLSVDPKTLNEAAHYLALSRRADGAWNSSYESAWALMALSQMMNLNQDLKANFSFTALLNNQLAVVTQQDKINYLNPVEQVIPFAQLRQAYPNTLTINRSQGTGSLFYRLLLKVNQPADLAQPIQKGLTLSRRYEPGGQDCPAFPCQPINQVSLKNLKSPLTVHLTLVVPTPMYYVSVEDRIPAGVELINAQLNTSQQGLPAQLVSLTDADPFKMGWNAWIFGTPQIGDRTIRWVAEQVPAGTYELTYQIQPQFQGSFHVLPAQASQIYYPEVEGSSAGAILDIQE